MYKAAMIFIEKDKEFNIFYERSFIDNYIYIYIK